MKQLVLTGLGNEMDLKTGKSIFTAIFNGGSVRIEISEEAAKVLTSNIYGSGAAEAKTAPSDDYSRPPAAYSEETEQEPDVEEFGGNGFVPVIEDTPNSVYDEDTGVEQV